MAGLGLVADLAESCLLGSNCVLTWRETEYYSRAGKQIIVTSLASRWLYLSHVQVEFEENKLASAAEWAGCVCVWISLLGCLSSCLSTCLSPQQPPVSLLIHQLCTVADDSILLFFLYQKRKINFEWIRALIHSLSIELQIAFWCQISPRRDVNTY